MNDQEFIRALKEKKESAWEEAYKRFIPIVRNFVKNNTNPFTKDDIKDVWQESIQSLFIIIEKNTIIENLNNLMWKIIHRKWQKKWKLNYHHYQVSIEEEESKALVDEQDNLERVRVIGEIAEDIFAQMKQSEKLSKCVEIIKGKFFDKKSDKEIAQEVGITEGFVRVKRSNTCMPYFLSEIRKHPKYDDLYD